MSVPIRPIRDAEAHEAALARVAALMAIEPEVAVGSPEGDELTLLALVIEDYEKRLYPHAPDPWHDAVEGLCQAVQVPFDPLDPELTLASLIAAHVRMGSLLRGSVALQEGDVVQLSPTVGNPMFAGCMMTVTESKPWGAKGFVQALGEAGEPGGRAYYRATWDEMAFVGHAVWGPASSATADPAP